MNAGVLGVQGNIAVQERLFRYLSSGRVHPGLIFSGPDKRSKWQVAIGIAKFLFCNHRGKDAFCNQCSSCKRIEKEIHPDVLLFKNDEDDSLKVETIREITHQMEVAPLEGGAKICVIEEAHRMNHASANAFLKTLEEPKPHRYFILLTTQLGSFLPTLLSRSIVFHFRPEQEVLTFTAEETERYQKLVESFQRTRDPRPIIENCEEKEACLRFIQFLQTELRKAATGDEPQTLFSSWSSYDCAKKFDEIVQLEGRLRSNANYGLMLESFLRQEF
ncbi:MAG: hypothetical protein EBZ49_03245 [Proteobacteria bacterium]|nr:hypothetical protein [Pseudomonadota bacterium]NDC23135.1 hypothetical protein [Pseudomonadota bacterium]